MTRRERLEVKIEKRQEWAEKAEGRAQQRFAVASDAVRGIEPGQPILVGHHSERKHRRALERHDANMRRAFEESELSKHHEQKAQGLARQLATSIFSDDPDATDQLAEKVRRLEARRDRMKEVNAAWRKAGKPDADNAQGWQQIADTFRVTPEALIEARKNMIYSWQKVPYPTYSLTNIGATIRNAEKRAKDVMARHERTAKAEAAGVLIEGTDYVRVTFPEKPARDVLTALRQAGFRWSGASWCGYRAKLPESVAALQNVGTPADVPTILGEAR